MAHFAQLDENNIVTQVVVVNNSEILASRITYEDGFLVKQIVESEKKGVDFLKGLFGEDTVWVQTSYNNGFRGRYAGIGDTYDSSNGIFVAKIVEPEVVPQIEETPVETQTETPVEAPAETPVETSAETQTETPVEAPAETPVETPVETQTETPVESSPTTEPTPEANESMESQQAPNNSNSVTE